MRNNLRVSDTDVFTMLEAWKLNSFRPFPESTDIKFLPGSATYQK